MFCPYPTRPDEAATSYNAEMNTLPTYDSGIMSCPGSGFSWTQNNSISPSFVGQDSLDTTIFSRVTDFQTGQNIWINNKPEYVSRTPVLESLMPKASISLTLCPCSSVQMPVNVYESHTDHQYNTTFPLISSENPCSVTHYTPFATYFPDMLSNHSISAQATMPLSYAPVMCFFPLVQTGAQHQSVPQGRPNTPWIPKMTNSTNLTNSTVAAVPNVLMPVAYRSILPNYCSSEPGFLHFAANCVTTRPQAPGQLNMNIQSTWSFQSAFPQTEVFQSTQPKTTSNQNSYRPSRRKKLGFRNNILFKTELCHEFMIGGSCPRGISCQFAHGEQDLRDPRDHPLYKTTVCQNYYLTGQCSRGVNCLHLHPSDPIPVRHSRDKNFPICSTPKTEINSFGKNTGNLKP
ncbi:hypothetical protein FGIG_04488 [Fasciola gigantica]|uniref:C3H1-type domain-containing protein n=1 Tax=Fasciola gigantica TaxID=46835 RepID=A0A504YE65_FASGI|nr:hypothetical protein FGIG_04488 [Fasciola gigantica]